MAEETLGQMQVRWGFIVASYTVEQVKDLIRMVVSREEPFYVYSVLLSLKFRFDCPDPVFDLLDDIRELQKQRAGDDEFNAWGAHTRSVLRQLIGDEPMSEELLRPASSNAVN